MNFEKTMEAALQDPTIISIMIAAYEMGRSAQRLVAQAGTQPNPRDDLFAYDAWEAKHAEARDRSEYAKGLAAATTYLPNSPFQGMGTGPAEQVLDALLDDPELAEKLLS